MAGGAVEEVVKPGRGFSLSLIEAGLMLKPVDRGVDDDVDEDDSLGILKIFNPVVKRISLV